MHHPMFSRKIQLFAAQDSVDRNTMFTAYSLMHFLFGVYATILLKWMKFSNAQIVAVVSAIHLLYEIKDYYLAYHTDWRKTSKTYDNSLLNSVMDQVCATVGILVVLWLHNSGMNRHLLGISVAYGSSVAVFAYMSTLRMVG
jgi:hypothetical protein